MANITRTLRQVDSKFPVGTSVSLYKRGVRPAYAAPGAPSGPVLATATVAADGSLAFASVADDTGGFIAYAQVSGKHVAVSCGSGGKLSWASSH